MTTIKDSIMNYSGILFLFVVISLVFYFSLSEHFIRKVEYYQREGYDNYNLANPGLLPLSETEPLLADTYEYTGVNHVGESNNSANWWRKPVFEVGSFAQITNNMKYWNNPDNGSCITPDFCQILYKDKHMGSNVSKPMPPVKNGFTKTRVNYYTTCQ